MFGCDSRAAAIDSCRKRSRKPWSCANAACRTLTVTGRVRTSSCPCQTSTRSLRSMSLSSRYRLPMTRAGVSMAKPYALAREGEADSHHPRTGVRADDRAHVADDEIFTRVVRRDHLDELVH